MTVAVLGNHDYGWAWSEPHVADRVTGELMRAGVAVLRNECLTAGGLDLVALDDPWARRCEPARALARRRGHAAVVLCGFTSEFS